MRVKISLICAAGFVLSSCSTTRSIHTTPTLGQSLETAYQAQIIDPTIHKGAPSVDPTRSALAIKRYKTDQVKKPKDLEATQP